MSKFKNKKPIIDGIKFDSISESRRYIQLKHLQELGEISHLRLQPNYPYYDKKNKKVLFKYIADFDYCTEHGEVIVEDVKSAYTAKLPIYRLKKKLIEDRYDVKIKEVIL